jgi:hypothetical protein
MLVAQPLKIRGARRQISNIFIAIVFLQTPHTLYHIRMKIANFPYPYGHNNAGGIRRYGSQHRYDEADLIAPARVVQILPLNKFLVRFVYIHV